MSREMLAQILGFAALFSSVLVYSRKEKSSLLLLKALQDVLWCVHYLLLACCSAAATSAICTTRSFVFYNSHKKWANSKWWVLAYLLFYVISAAVTWKNVYSILPALASCVSTVAFYQTRITRTKLLQIGASLVTLSYTVLQSHSLTVYLGVTLTISTAAISLIRHRLHSNPAHEQA